MRKTRKLARRLSLIDGFLYLNCFFYLFCFLTAVLPGNTSRLKITFSVMITCKFFVRQLGADTRTLSF